MALGIFRRNGLPEFIGGVVRFIRNAIGTTTTSGITLINEAPAASGAQQYSPGQSQIGQGWSTDGAGASMPVEMRWEIRPVQGTAAPTHKYVLMTRVNNEAWVDSVYFPYSAGIDSQGRVTTVAASWIGWTARALMRSPADGVLTLNNAAETGFSTLGFGPLGGSATSVSLQKKVTDIADNTATNVFTVTIPNANHAAAIRLMFLSSNGSTDAFESSRSASGMVVVARTTGANAVVTAATIDDAAIATVAAGATHTLAYNVSAVSGAVSASNTFTIQVTIDDSGNLGSNQLVAVAELLNAEATGVTIA